MLRPLLLPLQSFLSTLGTAAGSSGGLFAPKPLFWERPAFVIWTAAQPDAAKAEQAWADADPAYKGLKLKYDRSRDTVTRTGARPKSVSLSDLLPSAPAAAAHMLYRLTYLLTGPSVQITRWTLSTSLPA